MKTHMHLGFTCVMIFTGIFSSLADQTNAVAQAPQQKAPASKEKGLAGKKMESLEPGIYLAKPFSMQVIVPDAGIDSAMVIQPPILKQDPILRLDPPLKLVPKKEAPKGVVTKPGPRQEEGDLNR